MNTEVIILAAGQGKRMHSSLPKVLHQLGGRPLIQHVLDCARSLEEASIQIVVGHQGDRVCDALGSDERFTYQKQQLGTGHAVLQALEQITENARVLILYGDVPLIQRSTLRNLLQLTDGQRLGLVTIACQDPSGYGRIVRDSSKRVMAIVEESEATPAQLTIAEINSGILAVDASQLKKWLAQLAPRNQQGEYYLTDIVALAVRDGVEVATVAPEYPEEVQGINDLTQLAQAERFYQRRKSAQLLRAGCTLRDPGRLDIRGEVQVGRDCLIDVNVIFEGRVVLGDAVKIGPHCLIKDTVIGAGSEVLSHSLLDESVIGEAVTIGPFARLRPGTRLGNATRVGNFVETKSVTIGPNSKINHLSYLGDAEVGADVNIGAGTITCNFDGVSKHKTEIASGAFIGSQTALVAPAKIGAKATVGAGSVITKPVPDNELAIARARQKNIANWSRKDSP